MNSASKLTYKLSHTEHYMSQLDDVFKWIKDKNLKVDLSRYSRYKGYIDDFYDMDNPKDTLILESKFARLNEAAQECFQIVQVYEAFKDVKSNNFDERIKRIVAGQFYTEKKAITPSEISDKDFQVFEKILSAD
ncbi:hypothetical protein ACOAOT_03330 [Lacrimispora sp. AGF001]|uniref:hypothetical protein n=1 Tax=Lacrimispora sp. AGF001 TaxID=3401631 RepID=UPI003B43C6E4